MKQIAIITMLLMMTAGVHAQTMKQIFSSVPDSLMPTLTKNDRLDCIDLIENNMQTEVNNQLKGKTRLTRLTDNLAKLQLSSLSEMQFSKLPTDTGYVICVVHSVKADAWDSQVRFYNADWTLIPTGQFFTMPETNDFFIPSSDLSPDQSAKLLSKAGYPLLYVDFTSDTSVTVTYTSSNRPDRDFREKAQSHFREQITYAWDAPTHRFRRN